MFNWLKSLVGKKEVPTNHVPPQLEGVEVTKGENKVAVAETKPAPKKRAPRKSAAKKTTTKKTTTKKTTTKKKAAPKKAESSWKETK